MAIGQDIARTFRLPERQMQMAQLPSPNVATGGQGAPSQFEMPFEPAKDLVLQKDELVQDYYDKYYKVRTFANMMAKEGINVTSPDFNNPASLDANRVFMKAIADIKRTGDMLQQQRVSQKAVEKADLEGDIEMTSDPDAYSGIRGDTVETARSISPISRYSHVGLAPEVEEVNQMFSKSFDDKTMRVEAQREVDKLKSFYEDKLSSAKNEREKTYAQRQLNALGRALYNPNKDEDQLHAWNNMRRSQKDEATAAMFRLSLINRITNGDVGILESIDGVKEAKQLPSGLISIRERVGSDKSTGLPQYETKYIDLTNSKGMDKGTLAINEYLNKLGDKKLGYEDLMKYYGHYANNFGQIATEGVDPGWSKKLNKTVEALQKGTEESPRGWFGIPLGGGRGSKSDQKQNQAIVNTISDLIATENLRLPPGMISVDAKGSKTDNLIGFESMGGEPVMDFKMERRPKEEGGDTYVIDAMKNGVLQQYEISSKDSDKLELFLKANPVVAESVEITEPIGPPTQNEMEKEQKLQDLIGDFQSQYNRKPTSTEIERIKQLYL